MYLHNIWTGPAAVYKNVPAAIGDQELSPVDFLTNIQSNQFDMF